MIQPLLPLLVRWWCANIARGTAEEEDGTSKASHNSVVMGPCVGLFLDGTVRGALLRGVFGQDGVSSEDSFCTGIDQIQALLLLLGTAWAPV